MTEATRFLRRGCNYDPLDTPGVRAGFGANEVYVPGNPANTTARDRVIVCERSTTPPGTYAMCRFILIAAPFVLIAGTLPAGHRHAATKGRSITSPTRVGTKWVYDGNRNDGYTERDHRIRGEERAIPSEGEAETGPTRKTTVRRRSTSTRYRQTVCSSWPVFLEDPDRRGDYDKPYCLLKTPSQDRGEVGGDLERKRNAADGGG